MNGWEFLDKHWPWSAVFYVLIASVIATGIAGAFRGLNR